MNATPAICPACGELVVTQFATVPEHPDRQFPWMVCAASNRSDLLLPAPQWFPANPE